MCFPCSKSQRSGDAGNSVPAQLTMQASYRLLKTGLYCLRKCHSILNTLEQFVWNWYCGKLACQFRKYKRCGFTPGSGRSPGRGHSSPLQFSCLGIPIDRGAWQGLAWGWEKSDRTEVTQYTHTKFCFLFKCLIVFIF